MSDVERLAYSLDEAAEAVRQSRSTIDRAIKRGELTARYLSDHPVIYRDDLLAWITSAPTAKASA